uniref:Piwi domain-containing protein n=1 Tax=Trichuris muris TaxID=70415 RepID=A0A5S6QDF3_TRIMR
MTSKSDDQYSSFSKLSLVDLSGQPDYGRQGRRIDLVSNFVELKVLATGDLYVSQYHVNVAHEKVKLTRDDKRRVFWKFVKEMPQIFVDPFSVAYDGESIVFTRDSLPIKENEVIERQVKVQLIRATRPVDVHVALKKSGQVKLTFKEAMSGGGFALDNEQTPIQVIDVILSQGRACTLVGQSDKFCVVGNSVFEVPSKCGANLYFGMELWRGLFLSARVGEGYRPMVNVDVCHAAFYRPQSVLNYMCDVLNGERMRPRYTLGQLRASTRLSESELHTVGRAIKGLRVTVTHRQDESQFRVIGMASDASRQMFTFRDGREISVANYFKETYYELHYPHLPALQVGGKKKSIYLPVEVCKIANKQRCTVGKLTGAQTTLMIRQCATDAKTRLRMCMEMMHRRNLENDKFIKKFGLGIGQQLIQVSGRVLQAPQLEYKRGSQTTTIQPMNGKWQMRNVEFFEGGDCANFSVITFGRPNTISRLDDFCRIVAKMCNELGMNMGTKADSIVPVREVSDLETSMGCLLDEYKERNRVCRLIFVALTDSKQYAEVKRVGDVKYGIMTQCFMPRVLNDVAVKHSVVTATNLALKINMKMGGINTRIIADATVKSYLLDKATLVLGVDVTHPAVGDTVSPSIAAVVGNVDLSFAAYGSSIRVQPNRRESVIYLEDQYRERIKHFSDANSRQPSRILLFRDGVAEGQFKQILHEELKALRSACRSLDKSYRPGISFIVVQKRHHARFMCNDGKMAVGRGKNIPAGTVVDHRITSADGFDFYLCSHEGIQGTSKPAKYHVLYDDNNLNSDAVQSIAYYLCHLLGRCTRSVSIPAPVYFAHLACYRARQHCYSLTGSGESFGSRRNTKEPNSVDLTRAVTHCLHFVPANSFTVASSSLTLTAKVKTAGKPLLIRVYLPNTTGLIVTMNSSAKKKCRQYSVEYLSYGFNPAPQNPSVPFCLNCMKMFTNESMRPSKMKKNPDIAQSDKKDNSQEYYQNLRNNFERRLTLPRIVTERLEKLEKGTIASYEINQLIAKTGNCHNIGESLVLPAVSKIISAMTNISAKDILQSICLSNSIVSRRIDEMAGDIEE